MRVLFVARPDVLLKPGGDTIQLQKTKNALESLGVIVEVGMAQKNELEWADVVHVFNAQTPEISLPALRAAREMNKKAVLSTIWWDLSHSQYVSFLSKKLIIPNKFWRMSLPLYKILKQKVDLSRNNEISELLRLPDLLLPNSLEEIAHLKIQFGNDLPDQRIIMNAVDNKIFSPSLHVERSGIICFARLEPTKNQLALIQAVSGIAGEKLTLVGSAGNSKSYVANVHRLSKRYGFSVIEDHLSQNEVAALMSRHHVHALPSFRESPGLSSLEALATGLDVVVSTRLYCPIDTYFGRYVNKKAFLCDPYSVKSIKMAIEKSLDTRQDPGIEFPHELTWESVGKQTLAAYESI